MTPGSDGVGNPGVTPGSGCEVELPRDTPGGDLGARPVTATRERVVASAVALERVAVGHDRRREGLGTGLGARGALAADASDGTADDLGQARQLVEHVGGPREVVDTVRPQHASLVVAAIERGQQRFAEHGISCHLGLVPFDDTAEERIVEPLRREPSACVVGGGGIRQQEELLELSSAW